jgi:transposase
LAQRLVGDGEQVLHVPATLAAPGVRVLPVGHGRKSDPDDAVSVAVAARSVLAVRRVRVEDQAVVLPLLTKRRVANMRVAVTQRRAQRCADQ